MKYLLPCDCGRNIEIEPGQAGQVVRCTCGKESTAPTMLQIKALPAADEGDVREREPIGVLRKTFLTIGIVLLVPAVLFGFHLCRTIPQPIHVIGKRVMFTYGAGTKELYQDSTPIPFMERYVLAVTDEEIDMMPPMQLFFYFRSLESPTFGFNFQDNYQAVKDTYRIKVIADIILLLLAAAAITASFFMPKRNVIVTGYSGNEWQ